MDKDRCPFCGIEYPLKDVSLETIDITKVIGDAIEPKEILVRVKAKKTAAILCATTGFLGLHAFYVKKPQQGLLFLFIALFLIGGGGSLLFFTVLPSLWAYLFPVIVQIIWQVFFALRFLGDDVKDGDGVLMR
ncbi:MAG: hypothetical protein WC344_02025 [Bacilli bacterium]|jgi:TM2 domain-containing membrane protein YozV